MMVDAAVKGYGIACLPEELVVAEIATGQLHAVLEAWCPYFPGYFIYYPDRLQSRPALRVIVEALRDS